MCGDICNIGKTMIRNTIFGNGRTFYPGLAFLDNFGKGTPLYIFCYDVYLCFGTKKPNYEWISTRLYFKTFFGIHPTDYLSDLVLRKL